MLLQVLSGSVVRLVPTMPSGAGTVQVRVAHGLWHAGVYGRQHSDRHTAMPVHQHGCDSETGATRAIFWVPPAVKTP